jgi:hypothetical protein
MSVGVATTMMATWVVCANNANSHGQHTKAAVVVLFAHFLPDPHWLVALALRMRLGGMDHEGSRTKEAYTPVAAGFISLA